MEKPTAYLYSWRNGDFKLQEGRVVPSRGASYYARFYVSDRKFHQCDPNPGVIASLGVWFPERDDEKARDLFLQYEEKKIKKLQKEIERRQDNLIELSCAKVLEAPFD